MMQRKVFAPAFLALFLCFGLVACGVSSPATSPQSSSGNTESSSSASDSNSTNSHIDDFTIVKAVRGEDLSGDYWEMEVTVQNNTNEPKNFLGFQIDELDSNQNILNSYMSYNKNSCPTIVDPGQQFTIKLTEKGSDGIAGMQSNYCVWGDSISSGTKCKFSEKFKAMF